jgi:hypothetical protein
LLVLITYVLVHNWNEITDPDVLSTMSGMMCTGQVGDTVMHLYSQPEQAYRRIVLGGAQPTSVEPVMPGLMNQSLVW